MIFEQSRFQFVANENNDGECSYNTEPVITKQVYNEVGIEECNKILRITREIVRFKTKIYGIDGKHYKKGMLPEQIFFEDEITGNYLSLTQTSWENVYNSNLDLIAMINNNSMSIRNIVKNNKEEDLYSEKYIEEVSTVFQLHPNNFFTK